MDNKVHDPSCPTLELARERRERDTCDGLYQLRYSGTISQRKIIWSKSSAVSKAGNSGSWNRYDVPPVGVTTGDLHLMWDVPYEVGVLKAVGRRGGKIVVEEEIKTAGTPAAFRLSVDRNTIDADERDVAHVKIEVLDENGNVVPNANVPVQIIVEGAGRLIGLDNSNPVDHTSMKSDSRNTFNGLALAVVQSNNKPGKIRVRTNSSSLKNASIEITTGKTSTQIPIIEVMKK